MDQEWTWTGSGPELDNICWTQYTTSFKEDHIWIQLGCCTISWCTFVVGCEFQRVPCYDINTLSWKTVTGNAKMFWTAKTLSIMMLEVLFLMHTDERLILFGHKVLPNNGKISVSIRNTERAISELFKRHLNIYIYFISINKRRCPSVCVCVCTSGRFHLCIGVCYI